jgi:pyridoxine 5'-phosphate synthase PdxJ
MGPLSVNLNKVALLRNSRRHGVPDLLRFAALTRQAGADGITVHPRPDERHIRRDDVLALAELMKPWRPRFELNIEGYPDRCLLDIVRIVRPEQCTFVPDPPDAFTSEEGWKLDASDTPALTAAVNTVKRFGGRVILFIDPDPEVIRCVPEGPVKAADIEFRFHSMPARLLDDRVGQLEDRMDLEVKYSRATPEKALLDWLYLGESRYSRIAGPPLDVELERLDGPRLRRLARSMELVEQLKAWQARKKHYDHDSDVRENASDDE